MDITKDENPAKDIEKQKNNIKTLISNVDSLIDKSDALTQITTRATDPNAVGFTVFDEKKLSKLGERMPAINRATRVFGKKNSQVTSKLMSLNMVSQGPYGTMKQCLAQIERKKEALKENKFKLLKDDLKLRELSLKTSKIFDRYLPGKPISEEDSLKVSKINIEREEIESNTADVWLYYEGALKGLATHEAVYNEVRESHNIREDWDEKDMEEGQIEEHIKMAFRNAIRDLSVTNRVNHGTAEYFEQFGLNFVTAYKDVREYLARLKSDADIEVQYKFLDNMYNKYKNEYKKAMKHLGIKTLIDKKWLYLEDNSNEDEKE